MKFEMHLQLIEEKIIAVEFAKDKNLRSVVADETVKAMGQMLEADAAKKYDRHLQSHAEEFKYCKMEHIMLYLPYQEAFSIYNDLGYMGGNGQKMKRMLELLYKFIEHFEEKWKIELKF